MAPAPAPAADTTWFARLITSLLCLFFGTC
jgi:hypothetical protein